jgi:hypothetical protein
VTREIIIIIIIIIVIIMKTTVTFQLVMRMTMFGGQIYM